MLRHSFWSKEMHIIKNPKLLAIWLLGFTALDCGRVSGRVIKYGPKD